MGRSRRSGAVAGAGGLALIDTIIPAAGLGTRLRPFTDACPKELLPLGGRPMIAAPLREARAAGLATVTVVLSPEKWGARAAIRAEAGPLEVRFVEQPAPAGALDAVDRGRREARHLVLYPDYVHLPDQTALRQLVAAARSRPEATWFGLIRRTPTVAARSGRTARVDAEPLGGGRARLLAVHGDVREGAWHTTFAVIRGAEHQRRIAAGPLDDARVGGLLAGLAADDLLYGVELVGEVLDLGVRPGYEHAVARFAGGAAWREG